MKEALHPIAGSDCIFRETFNSPLITARNGGVATDVSFANGVGTFNGSTSYIQYNNIPNGTISLRVILKKKDSEARYIGDFRDDVPNGLGVYVTAAGIVTTTDASGTIYVNGSVGNTITINQFEEVIVTGLTLNRNINRFLLGARYTANNTINADFELCEVYNKALTAEEISLLHKKQLHAGLVTDGLVGYWDFMRGSSYDWSENGNNGVDTDIAYKHGIGAEFDGSTSKVNFGPNVGDYIDTFTLIGVLNPVSNNKIIFARRQSGGDTQYQWYIDTIQRFYEGSVYIGAATIFGDNKYKSMAVVINGSSSRFYLDGAPDGSTFNPTITSYVLDAILAGGLTGTYFKGHIKAFGIYNRALSAEEITQNNQYFKSRFNL